MRTKMLFLIAMTAIAVSSTTGCKVIGREVIGPMIYDTKSMYPTYTVFLKTTAKEMCLALDGGSSAGSIEATFGNRAIEVSGTIKSVAVDPNGASTIVLNGVKPGGSVITCTFRSDQAQSLATLREGQQITIRGTWGGFAVEGKTAYVRTCFVAG